MNKDLSGFSNRLSQLIYDKNLSQAEVCRMAGITKQSLSHYLSGTRMPRADVIISLAEILGVSVKYLLTGKEENKIIDAEGLTPSQIQLLKDYAAFFKEYNKLLYEHDKIIKRVNDSTEQLKLLSKQLSEERNAYFAELEKRKKLLNEATSTPVVVYTKKKVSVQDKEGAVRIASTPDGKYNAYITKKPSVTLSEAHKKMLRKAVIKKLHTTNKPNSNSTKGS